MKLKVHLFDGKITLAQQLLLILWTSLLVGVFFLWAILGVPLITSGLAGAFLATGQLLGLLATYFALTQFMLMGRIPWIESAFGLDRLASYHRFNGYAAIILLVIHPIFITLNRALQGQTSFIDAYLSLYSQPYVLLALVAEILFVGVVLSSIYIARKHLKFETWYYVHLAVYLAIVLASFHQFANGGSLAGSVIATNFWLGLYLFVALNIVVFRFGLLVYNVQRFQFTVSRVVKETPTTTSIYIKGKQLDRFTVTPGQFILVRFLAKHFIWQEHPFTVSQVPKNNELRITVRAVGDFTTQIKQLAVGTKVAIAGPFGRFTSSVREHDKQLLIAGGVGITPIRALAGEAVRDKTDTILLHANRDSKDVPLKAELDTLSASSKHLSVTYVYSNEPKPADGYSGYIDGKLIKRLVPDVKERDVYVCGPPPMMGAIVAQLEELGVAREQIHFEVFALHA